MFFVLPSPPKKTQTPWFFSQLVVFFPQKNTIDPKKKRGGDVVTRSLIEAQLLQLFDEALEPPLVVAIDAELGEPSSAPLISEEGRARQPRGVEKRGRE